MNELSGHVFSSLREGDIALYRGSGNGLTPILLVAAEETTPGCVERLAHEYSDLHTNMRSSPNLTPSGQRGLLRLCKIAAV